MAIVSDLYWAIICDSCGKRLGEGDGGSYPLSETEQRAREDIEYYDGRLEKDGAVTCCACIDNDEPVAPSESRTAMSAFTKALTSDEVVAALADRMRGATFPTTPEKFAQDFLKTAIELAEQPTPKPKKDQGEG